MFKFAKYLPIFIINIYRYFISPLKPQSCRFYPSCSQYALDSFITHGFFKGFYFSFLRIIKCHPFHPGGFDPVPLDNVRTRDDR